MRDSLKCDLASASRWDADLSKADALSTDQLIAFNDELAALARAGVPLEKGLLALGSDVPGKLGQFAAQLGARLERGESLQHLVEQGDSTLPKLDRAVVGAGLRGGRLAAALEGLASSLRRVAEIRRLLTSAALYPLLVLATAYALFLFSLQRLVPELLATAHILDVPNSWGLMLLETLHKTVGYWWPAPILLVVGVLLLEAYRWRLARLGQLRRNSLLSTLQRNGRWMAFCDLLALLIEHLVPLPEAVELAASASGDAALLRESQRFADDLRRGARQVAPQFPPLVGFALTSAASQARLPEVLRRVAQTYERRARRDAEWLRLYLPALLTAIVGGGAAALTTTMLLGPWFHMLSQLSRPYLT
jgi:general secretion pathway protein F